MKPFDRRLLRHARSTRRLLVTAVAAGLAQTACVVAQAALLAAIVTRAFLGGARVEDLEGPLGLLLGVVVLRAVLAWSGQAAAGHATAAAAAELRAALVARASRDAAGRGAAPSGEITALATAGLDAFVAYVARYLPQLVLAALAPLVVLAWVAAADRTSAVILGLTLPLIPLFLALVGVATAHRAESRLQRLGDLGAHFLDVVQGLPALRAFRRGRAQAGTIRVVAERFRDETMGMLRVALLSALVLELLATLGTALVAVAVGLHLAGGGIDLRTALAVLILVPEAYLPIRSVGAQFHASADGRGHPGSGRDRGVGDRHRFVATCSSGGGSNPQGFGGWWRGGPGGRPTPFNERRCPCPARRAEADEDVRSRCLAAACHGSPESAPSNRRDPPRLVRSRARVLG